MKKNKILILSTAAALSVGAVATTFAVYVDKSNDLEFTINGTVKADGDYVLEEIGETSTEKALLTPSAEQGARSYAYSYKLGLNTSDAGYNQPTTLADVTLKFSHVGLTEQLRQKLVFNCDIGGYTNYWATAYKAKEHLTTITTETETSYTYKSIALQCNPVEGQHIDFSIGLAESVKDFDTYKDLIDVLGTINFTLTIGDITEENFHFPYVVGDYVDNNWQQTEKYRMSPRMDVSNYEWQYVMPSDSKNHIVKVLAWVDPDGNEPKPEGYNYIGDTGVNGNHLTINQGESKKVGYSSTAYLF